MPIQPRRVWPNSTSWSTIFSASSLGTAKPMPIEPPVGEMIADFLEEEGYPFDDPLIV